MDMAIDGNSRHVASCAYLERTEAAAATTSKISKLILNPSYFKDLEVFAESSQCVCARVRLRGERTVVKT